MINYLDLPDESGILEYKKEFPNNNQILKTAIAFSNCYGGKIVLGIDDKKNIVGVDKKTICEKIEFLQKMIYENCTPNVFSQVYSQKVNDKYILTIEIPRGLRKPYFITSDGVANGTYVRIGNSTIKATDNIIRELEWQGRGVFLDETPVFYSSIDEFDFDKFHNFISSKKHTNKTQRKNISNDILSSYGLIYQEHNQTFLTIAGNLLFGKKPQKYSPEAFILCSHFKGTGGREIISTINCTGTLFEQLEAAYNFVENRLSKSIKIKSIVRDEKFEIPLIAVREILINAVVHRNYFIPGPVKIAIYNDRIEIFSPGAFPGPIDVRTLGNGVTYIRNNAIAKIFFEAKIVEKLGSGFATLFDEYRKYSLKKPIVIDGGDFIKCILPREKDDSASSIGKLNNHQIDNLIISNEEKIFQLFYQKEIWSISEIIKKTKIARSTAGLALKRLVEENKVLKFGKGPGSKYRLMF